MEGGVVRKQCTPFIRHAALGMPWLPPRVRCGAWFTVRVPVRELDRAWLSHRSRRQPPLAGSLWAVHRQPLKRPSLP